MTSTPGKLSSQDDNPNIALTRPRNASPLTLVGLHPAVSSVKRHT